MLAYKAANDADNSREQKIAGIQNVERLTPDLDVLLSPPRHESLAYSY